MEVDIRLAQDKALSAGERSWVRVRDSRIVDSEIAIASKDASTIELTLVDIRGSNLALTAYQKKPEFGPSSMKASGLMLKNNKVPFLFEVGSDVTIENKPVVPNARNVKSMVDRTDYGEGSR